MRGFRAQIVASTVALVAVVMLAVAVGTQLALELSEAHAEAHASLNILIASAVVGVCGVTLSGVVAWRVSHRALAPVRQMAERADDWSSHDLAHRFDLGPPTNELSRLGQTLDHLLDRVARAIRDEQRLTAELAHEIRTPLTSIHGAAELALLRAPSDAELRADLEAIAAGSRRLTDVVATLLDLAQAPRSRAGTAAVDAAIAEVAELVRPPIVLRVSGGAPPVAGPVQVVAQALAPLVENACRHARAEVSVEVRVRDLVEIAVGDDGPGPAEDVRASIFDPGSSGRGSSGLGLGIARRVARSLGGDVVLEGDVFVLRLPPA